jgi:hypothetical protein
VAQPVPDARQLLEYGGTMLAGVGLLVRLVPEVLQFDVEMIAAEDVAEPGESRLGLTVATRIDQVAHFAVAAAGEADEFFGMGTEGLQCDDGRPLAFGVG